jgi:multidrug efflux system membrane fusion protein
VNHLRRKVSSCAAPGSSHMLLVLVLFGGLGGCSEPAASAPARTADLPPCSVEVQPVTLDQTARSTTVVGVAEPLRRTTPSARVMARVTAAAFREGERVLAGQLLVRLDTRDLSRRREQAAAGQDVARAALSLAQVNVERMRALRASGAISGAQLEQAEAMLTQATAATTTAGAVIGEVDVNLSYARVEAPFAGVVVRRLVEVGDLVGPGQPVAVIEDDSRLRVVAPIGPDLARHLTPGQELFMDLAGARAAGTVEGVIPSGDIRAAGLRLQLVLENPSRSYQAGMFATLEVPVEASGEEVSAARIPRAALFERGQLTGVFVVTDQSEARLRWVVIDEVRGDTVRVLSGLRVGERVAVAPDAQCLADGRRVAAVTR